MHFALARSNMQALQSELHTYLSSSPSPTFDNVKILSDSFEYFRKIHQNWLDSLGELSKFDIPTECNFALQDLIASLKCLASSSNVFVNPNCEFGFEAFIKSGKLPAQNALTTIGVQYRLVSTLLKNLIASHPNSIEFVDLNPSIDPALFPQTSDAFFSHVIQLEFTGTLSVLYAFVDFMQMLEAPIFIRKIEIAPKGSLSSFILAIQFLDLDAFLL